MIDDLTLHQIQELAAGYVLGDLDAEETQMLEAVLQTYPELQVEIDRFLATLGLFPLALTDCDPPPHLEAAILQANESALHEAAQSSSFSLPAVPSSPNVAPDSSEIPSAPQPVSGSSQLPQSRPQVTSVSPRSTARRDHLQTLRRSWILWVGLGAGLVVSILGFNNFQLRQRLQLAQQPDDPDVVARLLQRPNPKLIPLTGSESIAPEASGSMAFIAGQWQEVVVTLRDLPVPPQGQIYRLWAEFDDGNVILCGEIQPDPTGTFVARFEPTDLPNQGSGLSDVFATLENSTDPLQPTGPIALTGVL